MKKYLFLTIILFGIFLIAGSVNAATEFISTIQQSGGDYSTLSSWEAAVQSDLTATTTRVFSGTGTGELSNGDTVTCVSGGAHNGITARVVATTTTQILLDNATSSTDVVLSATDKWEKDVSNYFTVSGTGSELGDTAIATAKIDGAWTNPDQTGVEIDGWSTDSTHYISIYTTTAARHNGKWDTSAYRLEVTGGFTVKEDYIRFDGLQIKASTGGGIYHDHNLVTESRISNNIIWVDNTGQFNCGIEADGSTPTLYVWNNVIRGSSGSHRGIRIYNGTWYIYNNTIYGFDRSGSGQGIVGDPSTTAIIKNCAVFGNNDDFSGSNSTIDYCASDDGDGDHSVQPSDWSSVFEDYPNVDFHLKSSDTDLKNAGTNLYSDANLQVTDDIDGDTRPASNWDIGADEEMTATEFVSTIMQGTNGDYHSLSEWEGAIDCDLTASSTRVYSFDAPSGWISDGATVHIDGGNATATLLHMASSSQALLIDIQGSFDDNDVVTDASSNTMTLSNNGAPAIATAEIDGTWTSADTTAVTITDWTTATSTYIRIYTTDAARHTGKWDASKYILDNSGTSGTALSLQEDYVRIYGLQIIAGNSSGDNSIGDTGNGTSYIAYNIIDGNGQHSGYEGTGSGCTTYIWNNVVYNADKVVQVAYGTFYLYNNTVYGTGSNTAGIRNYSGTATIKNCAVFNNGDDFYNQGTTNIDYCASDDGDGTNSVQPSDWSAVFEDYPNGDFHLKASADLRDAGVDLSEDSNLAFNDDIDGEGRGAGGAWDIGADEKKRATIINAPLTNKLTGGLVGHWTFNGQDMDWASTTAEALDRSGNSNNGNAVNDPTPVIGISGQALEFDGVDDYVDVGTSDDIFLAGTPMTISAWIYPHTIGYNRIVSRGNVTNDDGNFELFDTNTLRFEFRGSTTLVREASNNAITLNTWQHVLVTWDGSVTAANVHFYVNGVETTYKTTTNGVSLTDTTGHYTWIGDRYGRNRAFNGLIDEVRVYNRVLSTEEVGELYRAGARRLQPDAPMVQKQTGGLVGHWTFNGQDMDWASTTAEALDRSDNSNNGNVVNGATPVIGKIGQAMEFDGVNDYVDIQDDSSLDSPDDTGEITIALWIKSAEAISAGTGKQNLLARLPHDVPMYHIGVNFNNDGKLGFYMHQGTPQHSYGIKTSWNADEWYHVAATMDEATNLVSLYVNGVSDGTVGNTGTISSDTDNTNLIIGRSYDNEYFNGTIDEVRIYDRALSVEEVGDLYRAGAGRFKLK